MPSIKSATAAIFACVLTAVLMIPRSARALDSTTGLITQLDLNSGATGRGLCVWMNGLPTGTGAAVACLYTANPLYREIVAVLVAAFFNGKPVNLLTVPNTTGLFNEITTVRCS